MEAGADGIFPEAMTDLPMYKKFADAVKVPILANITEFGRTPLFTVEELRGAGIAMALHPLSAFRAMNQAALNVYQAVRRDGTQQSVVNTMQTRNDLYDYLGYHTFEKKLDALVQILEPQEGAHALAERILVANHSTVRPGRLRMRASIP